MGIFEIAQTLDLEARKTAFLLAQAQTNVQSEKFQLLIEYFKPNLKKIFGIVVEKTDISSLSWSPKSKRTEKGTVSLHEERHSLTLTFSKTGSEAMLQEFIEEMKRVANEYDGEFKGYQKSLTRGFPDYITIHFPHPNPIQDSEES